MPTMRERAIGIARCATAKAAFLAIKTRVMTHRPNPHAKALRLGIYQPKRIPAAFVLFSATYAAAQEVPSKQVKCVAEAMYFEARDQGWKGMLAVGVVIKNRMMNPRWPSTACQVVRQGRTWNGNPVRHKCQFSYYCDGKHERPAEPGPWTTALDLAQQILVADLTIVGLEDATHYHTTSVRPRWSRTMDPCGKIGQHVFYE